MTYQSEGKPLSRRIVACHHFSEIPDTTWFLHAWQLQPPPGEGRGWRTFRMDRIVYVELLSETFTPREEPNIPAVDALDEANWPDYFEIRDRLNRENDRLRSGQK